MIVISDVIVLREDEVQIDFIQSSGPGGQNVNKVASKAQLRFDTASTSLPDEVRTRLKLIARGRITEDGILLIEARRYRTQEQNRADAIRRLVEIIRQAEVRPKSRHATRPTRASQQRRLKSKHERSEVKRLRREKDHLEE